MNDIVFRIKKEILLSAGITAEITPENIDEIYYEEDLGFCDEDFESEFRYGDVETNIKPLYSRHYESKSVAKKLSDGTWIGWTYWYGGGKHGCPGEIGWMEDAYELDVKEEEKLVLVRTFSKREKTGDSLPKEK